MKECCLARRKNPRSEIYQTKAHYEFTYLYYLMKHKKTTGIVVTTRSKSAFFCYIYLTGKETHIIQYPFNTRNPYQILP